MKKEAFGKIQGVLRIALGLIFLWAFFDKLLGLGFATLPEKSWLAGNSPTSGFLSNSVYGPFVNIFHSLAGNPIVDWLFMLGLLLVGLSLISGILTKIAGLSGSMMMLFMWLSMLPPKNNPLIDEHIIYIIILIGFIFFDAGDHLGLGKKWSSLSFVKNNKWMK